MLTIFPDGVQSDFSVRKKIAHGRKQFQALACLPVYTGFSLLTFCPNL
jgi:hypothetical protein